MEYTCHHCGADLDEGDIFEHFLSEYQGDVVKARETAGQYGWTETNKKHFDKSIIVQPNVGEQYTICPECEHQDPFANTNKSDTPTPTSILRNSP